MNRMTAGFIASLTLLATPVMAEEVSLPRFGETITVTLPEGFVALGERQDGDVTVFEALRTGETPDTWTQKYEVTAHGEWLNDPAHYVSVLSGSYFDQCKDTFGESAFGSKDVPGSEDSYGYWISCGTMDIGAGPQSVSVMVLAIATADHHYSVRWYERGAASAEELDDDDRWEARLDHIVTTTRF